jgi:hypothetical protein
MFGKPVIILSGILTVLCYLIMFADGTTICYCSTEPPVIPPGAVIIEVQPGPSPTPIPPVDDPQ